MSSRVTTVTAANLVAFLEAIGGGGRSHFPDLLEIASVGNFADIADVLESALGALPKKMRGATLATRLNVTKLKRAAAIARRASSDADTTAALDSMAQLWRSLLASNSLRLLPVLSFRVAFRLSLDMDLHRTLEPVRQLYWLHHQAALQSAGTQLLPGHSVKPGTLGQKAELGLPLRLTALLLRRFLFAADAMFHHDVVGIIRAAVDRWRARAQQQQSVHASRDASLPGGGDGGRLEIQPTDSRELVETLANSCSSSAAEQPWWKILAAREGGRWAAAAPVSSSSAAAAGAAAAGLSPLPSQLAGAEAQGGAGASGDDENDLTPGDLLYALSAWALILPLAVQVRDLRSVASSLLKKYCSRDLEDPSSLQECVARLCSDGLIDGGANGDTLPPLDQNETLASRAAVRAAAQAAALPEGEASASLLSAPLLPPSRTGSGAGGSSSAASSPPVSQLDALCAEQLGRATVAEAWAADAGPQPLLRALLLITPSELATAALPPVYHAKQPWIETAILTTRRDIYDALLPEIVRLGGADGVPGAGGSEPSSSAASYLGSGGLGASSLSASASSAAASAAGLVQQWPAVGAESFRAKDASAYVESPPASAPPSQQHPGGSPRAPTSLRTLLQWAEHALADPQSTPEFNVLRAEQAWRLSRVALTSRLAPVLSRMESGLPPPPEVQLHSSSSSSSSSSSKGSGAGGAAFSALRGKGQHSARKSLDPAAAAAGGGGDDDDEVRLDQYSSSASGEPLLPPALGRGAAPAAASAAAAGAGAGFAAGAARAVASRMSVVPGYDVSPSLRTPESKPSSVADTTRTADTAAAGAEKAAAAAKAAARPTPPRKAVSFGPPADAADVLAMPDAAALLARGPANPGSTGGGGRITTGTRAAGKEGGGSGAAVETEAEVETDAEMGGEDYSGGGPETQAPYSAPHLFSDDEEGDEEGAGEGGLERRHPREEAPPSRESHDVEMQQESPSAPAEGYQQEEGHGAPAFPAPRTPAATGPGASTALSSPKPQQQERELPQLQREPLSEQAAASPAPAPALFLQHSSPARPVHRSLRAVAAAEEDAAMMGVASPSDAAVQQLVQATTNSAGLQGQGGGSSLPASLADDGGAAAALAGTLAEALAAASSSSSFSLPQGSASPLSDGALGDGAHRPVSAEAAAAPKPSPDARPAPKRVAPVRLTETQAMIVYEDDENDEEGEEEGGEGEDKEQGGGEGEGGADNDEEALVSSLLEPPEPSGWSPAPRAGWALHVAGRDREWGGSESLHAGAGAADTEGPGAVVSQGAAPHSIPRVRIPSPAAEQEVLEQGATVSQPFRDGSAPAGQGDDISSSSSSSGQTQKAPGDTQDSQQPQPQPSPIVAAAGPSAPPAPDTLPRGAPEEGGSAPSAAASTAAGEEEGEEEAAAPPSPTGSSMPGSAARLLRLRRKPRLRSAEEGDASAAPQPTEQQRSVLLSRLGAPTVRAASAPGVHTTSAGFDADESPAPPAAATSAPARQPSPVSRKRKAHAGASAAPAAETKRKPPAAPTAAASAAPSAAPAGRRTTLQIPSSEEKEEEDGDAPALRRSAPAQQAAPPGEEEDGRSINSGEVLESLAAGPSAAKRAVARSGATSPRSRPAADAASAAPRRGSSSANAPPTPTPTASSTPSLGKNPPAGISAAEAVGRKRLQRAVPGGAAAAAAASDDEEEGGGANEIAGVDRSASRPGAAASAAAEASSRGTTGPGACGDGGARKKQRAASPALPSATTESDLGGSDADDVSAGSPAAAAAAAAGGGEETADEEDIFMRPPPPPRSGAGHKSTSASAPGPDSPRAHKPAARPSSSSSAAAPNARRSAAAPSAAERDDDAADDVDSDSLFDASFGESRSLAEKPPPGPKKRIPWGAVETAALKMGHARYGTRWADTLKKFKRLFHESRSSVDLKDKWRNMGKGPDDEAKKKVADQLRDEGLELVQFFELHNALPSSVTGK